MNSGKIPCISMRRAHFTMPASISSATSTAKESLGLTLQRPLAVVYSKARFVSVMSDSSTNTTIVEQEVVYVQYVNHGTPVTKLASIQALEHGNAEGVHNGVIKELATMELTADKLQPAESAFPTLVCANFDGASVMMGSKSGVATSIQQSFPWVIPIHCVANKLELGILDGVKAVK